ncbi:retrovirus-related pol polyprotein from transposon TNT 1-94 [Tanacetum coccineum]
MSDHSWIESMQDELHQFERLDVWELVPRRDRKNIIAGYKQEEGIDFEESFALTAHLEAVRMFVAFIGQTYYLIKYMSTTSFLVLQIQIFQKICKSHDRFVNLDFPDHVYKLKKPLYGLK